MIGIDNEYIAENALRGDQPGGRPDVKNTYCEVMQVGACKLDSEGNEIGVLNIIVRPHEIASIPLWLSNMTGMTDGKRVSGIAFPDALQKLVDFIGDDKDIWTFNGDWWVLEGNAEKHNISLPFEQPFKRVKPILPDYGITLEKYTDLGFDEVCSGGLYKVLGIDLPVIEGVGLHDAAHDARSLVHSMFKLLENKK